MALSAGVQLFLSAACLALGLGLLARGVRRPPVAAAVLMLALATLLLFAAYFVSDYFTGEGVNGAVLYHLRYGLGGAGLAEYAGLAAAALAGLGGAAALLWWLMRRVRARAAAGWSLAEPVALLSVAVSIAVHPVGAALLPLFRAAAPAYALPGARTDPALQEEFDRYYRTPRAVARGPSRNLVYIYLEGLERNYLDGTLFPGLLPQLGAREAHAVSFTGIEQLPGTEWTMAGMVASQCGIPLFTPDDGNAMSGMDAFLPAASCMGDLLRREGYRLAYYGGANLSFAGKGKFYASHGFHEVVGRAELEPRLPAGTPVNSWGLYDDALFAFAYEKYAELGRAGGRFALFLLTLDTHPPDGHVSPACAALPYGDGGNPILNAARCSDRLVHQFVERIRASPWAADTVVVVASDHLSMRNSAYDRLTRKPRRNLLLVIDPRADRGRRIATPGSLLDVAPTVMSFLGYDAEVGLGTDLQDAGPQARARAAHVRSRLEAWHAPISRFWAFPRIERYLEVQPGAHAVVIDGRAFAVPSLIEVDRDLQTVIRFPRPGSRADEAVQAAGGGPFLLVAPCISKDLGLPEHALCLFAGRNHRIDAQFIVRRAARFAPQEIRRMLGAAA